MWRARIAVSLGSQRHVIEFHSNRRTASTLLRGRVVRALLIWQSTSANDGRLAMSLRSLLRSHTKQLIYV
eukprot:3744728-Prymnesium_polylepis.1